MTEVQLDLGATNNKKPRYESKKVVLNEAKAVKIRLKNSKNILG